MTNYRIYIHAHHIGSLLEIHAENYFESRLQEFDETKAKTEPSWKIERRKKLFADVTDLLPPELRVKAEAKLVKAEAKLVKARDEWVKARDEWVKAGAEFDKARAEWVKAEAEFDKAGAEWVKALTDYGLDQLHTKLCLSRNPDCPWNGKTIFPEDRTSPAACHQRAN